MATFLRRGDLRQTAMIAVVVGAMAGLALYSFHTLASTRHTLILAAAMVPVVAAVSWLLSAKLVSDAATVHRQMLAAEREHDLRYADDAPFHCSEEEFARIAEHELEALPEWLQAKIRDANVAIGIEDERPGEPRVLGLYSRSSGQSQITLYRVPILRVAGNHHRLRRQIHDTLLHELGHLFGMTEADLDRWSIGNNPLPDAAPIRPPDWE